MLCAAGKNLSDRFLTKKKKDIVTIAVGVNSTEYREV